MEPGENLDKLDVPRNGVDIDLRMLALPAGTGVHGHVADLAEAAVRLDAEEHKRGIVEQHLVAEAAVRSADDARDVPRVAAMAHGEVAPALVEAEVRGLRTQRFAPVQKRQPAGFAVDAEGEQIAAAADLAAALAALVVAVKNAALRVQPELTRGDVRANGLQQLQRAGILVEGEDGDALPLCGPCLKAPVADIKKCFAQKNAASFQSASCGRSLYSA